MPSHTLSSLPIDVLTSIASFLPTLFRLYPFQLISQSCHKSLISPQYGPLIALDLSSQGLGNLGKASPLELDRRLAYLVKNYCIGHVEFTMGGGKEAVSRLRSQVNLLAQHLQRRDTVQKITVRFLKCHRDVRKGFSKEILNGIAGTVLLGTDVARSLLVHESGAHESTSTQPHAIASSQLQHVDKMQTLPTPKSGTPLLPNVTHLAFVGADAFCEGTQLLAQHYAPQLRHFEFRRYERRFRKDYTLVFNTDLPVLESFIGDAGVVALLHAPNLRRYQGAFSQEVIKRLTALLPKKATELERQMNPKRLRIHLSLTDKSQSVRLNPKITPIVEALHYEVKCASIQELTHKLNLFPNVKYLSLGASSDIIDNTPYGGVLETPSFPAIHHVSFVDLDFAQEVGLKRNLIKLIHLFPNAGCTLINVVNGNENRISIAQLKLTLGHFLKMSQQFFESKYNAVLIHQFNVLATILDRRMKRSKQKRELGGPCALQETIAWENQEEALIRSLLPSVKNYFQYCHSFPSPIVPEDKCKVWF